MAELANLALVAVTMTDISAPGTVYAAAPVSGHLLRAYSCLQGSISGSDCTWSMTVNGNAVTDSTVTVTASGSAAGDVDSVEFGRMDPQWVNKGDALAFVSAGESSTTERAHFTAVIRT